MKGHNLYKTKRPFLARHICFRKARESIRKIKSNVTSLGRPKPHIRDTKTHVTNLYTPVHILQINLNSNQNIAFARQVKSP